MRLPTLDRVEQGFTVTAFGFRIHLWNETDVEWGATIDDGEYKVSCRFDEETVALAQLHILAEVRNRALVRWKDKEFPAYETLMDSWEPVTFVNPD
jgi:hypothetical protein